ncbi:MAG: hypothetical protein IJ770_02715 [Alphaproteobacteria bacterium]|nr:hypothetical protein [Alphaproteobacteria bacterium]
MIKYILIILAVAAIVGGVASLVHLRNVNAKNKAEMAKYDNQAEYINNLGKTLVMYYSMSGQTEKIAKQIAELTGGELYEIATEEAYSSPSVYMKSKKEYESKQYPKLAKNLPNFADYDIIFVGGPVWWYTMAVPLFSLLETADFSGKKVVPFSTQGSNYGAFFEDFVKLAKNADIQTSANFNNMKPEFDAQVKNKIIDWLNKL